MKRIMATTAAVLRDIGSVTWVLLCIAYFLLPIVGGAVLLVGVIIGAIGITAGFPPGTTVERDCVVVIATGIISILVFAGIYIIVGRVSARAESREKQEEIERQQQAKRERQRRRQLRYSTAFITTSVGVIPDAENTISSPRGLKDVTFATRLVPVLGKGTVVEVPGRKVSGRHNRLNFLSVYLDAELYSCRP